MNNKDIRKYDLMVQIGNQGGAAAIKELAGLDFNLAVDLWEYKMLKNIDTFAGEDVFQILESVSESKLRAAVLGNPALQKLIYGTSEASCSGANLQFLATLIVTSKINEAEDILRKARQEVEEMILGKWLLYGFSHGFIAVLQIATIIANNAVF